MILSPFPFIMEENKRIDAAICISLVNNMLVHGCFDYDIATGAIIFRMTNSYMDCTPGEDLFTYMISYSLKAIDEYNDKLFMVSKNVLTVEQFLSSLKK